MNGQLLQLAGHLCERALQEWNLLNQQQVNDFGMAVKTLKDCLYPGSKVLVGQDFQHTTQIETESVADLISRLELNLSDCFWKWANECWNKAKCRMSWEESLWRVQVSQVTQHAKSCVLQNNVKNIDYWNWRSGSNIKNSGGPLSNKNMSVGQHNHHLALGLARLWMLCKKVHLYRLSFAVTKPDLFTLLHIDDLLDQLDKSKYFTLDLASEY